MACGFNLRMNYIELKVKSNFSFLRGASHPAELIAQAVKLGYEGMAISDWHTLSGIVRAHEAARELNLSLVVGTTIEVEESPCLSAIEDESCPRRDKLPFVLNLYATSVESYGQMSNLLTVGKMRAPKGQCFVNMDDVADSSRGLQGIITLDRDFVLSLKSAKGILFLRKLKEVFGSGVSLALERHYEPFESVHTERIIAISREYNLPLVVTNDVLYHLPERHLLQDILSCIRLGTTLEHAGYSLLANGERWLKRPEEMERLFKRFPQALERSCEIFSHCRGFSLTQIRYEYPHEICPDGYKPQDYLSSLVWKHARRVYGEAIPKRVEDLLGHELKLIGELNYARYFLTVYDIVCYARKQGILCQGRGAAANSAVCFVLGITAVDPDRINLLFERFISKERNEPPDIDVDFEHERREEVIQYIYSRFGRERAAIAAEVITYRTRSAVRDVGKVWGLSEEQIKILSRLMRRAGQEKIEPEMLAASGFDPESSAVQNTIKFSRILKGFPRHLSQHVGGFIVSEKPLSHIVPLENAAMIGRTVMEWDKDDLDTMGLLKIDILALGMLSCIGKSLELVNNIRESRGQEKLSLSTVPAEEPEVYDLLCRADTVGVFQVESRAQMSMLPRLRPRTFYDLVIEVAIVRPGPIVGGMVHPYLLRRAGKERVTYPSEAVKRVLQSTLGVPIFQEQVMQLAMCAAGFSGGEADELRRAMSGWRKNKSLLEEHGKRIVQGMLERGYSREFAQRVFEQIHGFGEYGFPQSHAASFALLVYVSAWLKCYYPQVFAVAILNSQPMGFYQPAQLIADAQRHGVKVLSVDVNYSQWNCVLEGDSLRLGLRLISGLMYKDAEKLVKDRLLNGPYSSVRELWERSGVRVATLRRLAAGDAWGSLGLKRQEALWEIARYREGILPLFSGLKKEDSYDSSQPSDELLPEICLQEQTLIDYEETGFSLKAHPLTFLRSWLNSLGVLAASELLMCVRKGGVKSNGEKTGENRGLTPSFSPFERRVRSAGLVLVRQRPPTAKGVVFMTLEDETGFVNLIISPELYESRHETVCYSVALLVEGRLQHASDVVYIQVEKIKDISSLLAIREDRGFDGHSRDFC